MCFMVTQLQIKQINLNYAQAKLFYITGYTHISITSHYAELEKLKPTHTASGSSETERN